MRKKLLKWLFGTDNIEKYCEVLNRYEHDLQIAIRVGERNEKLLKKCKENNIDISDIN